MHRQALWCISHNVPFDVAYAVDDATRVGWCVIFSEQETGKKFNWTTEEFSDP